MKDSTRRPPVRGLQQLAIQPTATSVLFGIFRLSLYWKLNRVSLSGQSVNSCWAATLVVPKLLLVIVLKQLQAGAFDLKKRNSAPRSGYGVGSHCAPKLRHLW